MAPRGSTRCILWASLLLLTGCEGFVTDAPVAGGAAAKDPGYILLGAEVLETDERGQVRYRLSATRIVQDPMSLQVEVEQPLLDLRDGNEPAWRVSARRGQLPGHARNMQLAGEVQINALGAGEASGLIVNTDTLRYDFLSGKAETDDAVTLSLAGHRLQGIGLEADLVAGRARLKKSVQGAFEP